jgi:lipooligosaccharide transport system ATP-binding protein
MQRAELIDEQNGILGASPTGGRRDRTARGHAHMPAANVMPNSPKAQTEAAIKLRGIVKRFGSLTAVDGLDLDVPYGACVGLLGPNGAGKSTTMKALTAQVIPDEGELSVLGYQLPQDSKQARAAMGVVPQLDNLDVALTVEQNLLVFAHLYRVPAGERKRAIVRALQMANLVDRRASKVDQLSGGMRRRLLIARALLHQPRLVLLDEPTVGLDPQVRQELWALIDLLRSEGVSILMSTHYIEEAERLCDTVTIMSHGKAVAVGAPHALIREHAGPQAIEVYGAPARLREVEALAHERGWRTRRTGTSIAILQSNGDTADLDGERRGTNLEDVFVLLTGEEIE